MKAITLNFWSLLVGGAVASAIWCGCWAFRGEMHELQLHQKDQDRYRAEDAGREGAERSYGRGVTCAREHQKTGEYEPCASGVIYNFQPLPPGTLITSP